MFRPASVVIYGASTAPDKLSGRPLAYMREFAFPGRLYAVNFRQPTVQGLRAYASASEIGDSIDLAVIVVPAESVRAAIMDCAGAGVRVAIVFASGFAEASDAGAQEQARIAEIGGASGMRILGPNCLGAFSVQERVFATFSTAFDSQGAGADSPVALVAQSGAVGTFTYSLMGRLGIGVRYFANTGNQLDITAVELLEALVERPDVEVLLGHLESVADLNAVERLAQSARKHGKPLVFLRGGRSAAGARAIAAHTASPEGNDQAFQEILDRTGALRVGSMEQLADTALILTQRRALGGNRLTVVTLSGGAGALAVDAAEEAGWEVNEWPADEQEPIAQLLPDFASTRNPIDLTGAMINDVGLLRRALSVVGSHDGTDALLVILGNADKDSAEIVAALEAAHARTAKPFAVAWTGGSGSPSQRLLEAGVPTYPDPARAVASLSSLMAFALGRDSGTARNPVTPPGVLS